MTPPSWAYPNATVWDDFATAPGTMDGAFADSGQQWVVPTDGMTVGFGITPYNIAHSHLVPNYRGLSQSTEHDSCMGWDLRQPSPPDVFGGDEYFVTQYVPVPGATSENFFVKMEFYCPTFFVSASDPLNHTGEDIHGLAADPAIQVKDGWFFDRWQIGFDVVNSTNPFQELLAFPGGPYPGNFPPGEPYSTIPIFRPYQSPDLVLQYGDSWHTWELRAEGGNTTLYVDGGVIWRQRGAVVPFFDPIYVSADAGVGGFALDGLPDRSCYVDHFQAGPGTLVPPVPSLRVAPGPISLLFEPPRINV